jgi:hypothetical protein
MYAARRARFIVLEKLKDVKDVSEMDAEGLRSVGKYFFRQSIIGNNIISNNNS